MILCSNLHLLWRQVRKKLLLYFEGVLGCPRTCLHAILNILEKGTETRNGPTAVQESPHLAELCYQVCNLFSVGIYWEWTLNKISPFMVDEHRWWWYWKYFLVQERSVRFFLYIELLLIYLFLCKNVLSSNNTETKKSTLVTELGIDLYL